MSLFKSASTVSLLTLASRVTGLLRDWLMASAFGVSGLTDAFNVAFRIPNLLRRLFGEGAFSQAFVPVLAASKERDGIEATRHLIDAVATALAWALAATCLAGMLAAPLLVLLLASGLDAASFEAAARMTRWMFPFLILISLAALTMGALNSMGSFFMPALAPALSNLTFIAAAPFLAARWGVYGLSTAVLCGGAVHFVSGSGASTSAPLCCRGVRTLGTPTCAG